MQCAHIFGYTSVVSFSINSIKNNSLFIFKRFLLFFGLTGLSFSTTKTMFDSYIYSQRKLNCEILIRSLDQLIASETDPVRINEYKQERQELEKNWAELDAEEKSLIKQDSTATAKIDNDTQKYPQTTWTTPANLQPITLNCYNPHPEVYNAIFPAAFNDIDKFIDTFKRKLPSKELTRKVIKEAKRQHPALRQVIKQLKDEELYTRVKHPTRLLFVGPSGCGKTTTAEALAKYCDLTCIFIKASSIATTYQNSGAQFFEMLFRSLKENDSEEFLVIIDEISLITQMSSDGKDEQQNKMATAFWLGLDEIRNERHICVIGTTNSDPKKLSDQLKTRFANNIFYFEQPKIDTVINLIKDNLNFVPKYDLKRNGHKCPEKLHACSDSLIRRLAESVSHLSLREIEDLVEKAKAQVIMESDNPYALVTEMHLEKAFAEHTQSWYAKAWQNKATYLKPLISPRAFTLYTALTGLIMHFYTDKYKEHGLFITAMASLISNYLPRPYGNPNDSHIFSNITHWFTNYKHSYFFRERVGTT